MHVGRAVILDGYVDEPTALGVPPYLGPYPRYVAGVFQTRGVEWDYMTVDVWRREAARQEQILKLREDDLLVVIAGLTVPGHYRGGTPMTLSEMRQVGQECRAPVLVAGPVQHGYALSGGLAALAADAMDGVMLGTGEPALAVDAFLSGADRPQRFSYDAISGFATAGASVVARHPGFPHIIAEIETARGCERADHCSFCTEGLVEGCDFRPAEDIVAEISALYLHGVRHFRIGKQPNFFAWPGKRDRGAAVPDPEAIARLYRMLRQAAPHLETLHIDNVNPGFVASFPDECLDIATTIASYNTPGDVGAMGVESADPAVVLANQLKCTPEQALCAIEIFNRAGAARDGASLPRLLPGINLLYGLAAETSDTYEINFRFLMDVLDRGLLLRRINLRQVMLFPGTPLHDWTGGKAKINKVRFRRWKRRVQEEIEHPMLQRVAPVGTMLPGLVTEFHDGDVTFGRQLASYPLLAGIPARLELRKRMDAVVVGHGFRSVTVLPYPIEVNSLSVKALSAIPGIGRKRALRIANARPFADVQQLVAALDDPEAVTSVLHLFKV